MVSVVNTGVTLQGAPIGFHPQTGKLLTNRFEVINPDNSVVRPYARRVASLTPDLSIPSRGWVFSPRENTDYSHLIVYDFEQMAEVARTDTDYNLNVHYDHSSPLMFFTEFGEKYYLLPLNARRGRAGIWGYGTLGYSRINVYWSYIEMYMYAWETGLRPGFIGVSESAISGKKVLLATELNSNHNIFKLLRTDVTYYLGFGSWWSHMFDLVFEAPAIAWVYGTVRRNVLILDKGDVYFTYMKDVDTTVSQIVLRRLSDGAEVELLSLPYKYASYWIYWRRCAKDKILFVIYYGDVRKGEGKYSPKNVHVELVIVNLATLNVTRLGEFASGVTAGNEYGFLDSNGVLYRIQLAEEYLVRLYREGTRIRVVTTRLDGTPISLTLNVYKCDGWMHTYKGGNRRELIGTVITGSDGIGYFEYTGSLAFLHFEWARDDEGYAYNYIVTGRPKYRALKYGDNDWYA